MPIENTTADDLSRAYAQKVRAAVPTSRDAVILALRDIKQELNRWYYTNTNQFLSDADKGDILRKAGELLGLDDPNEFILAYDEAQEPDTLGLSAGSYVAMVSHISSIIRKVKK